MQDVQFAAFQDLYNAALLTEYPGEDGYVWKTSEHGALEEAVLELERTSKRWAAVDATRPSATWRPTHPDQPEVPALRPIPATSSRLPFVPNVAGLQQTVETYRRGPQKGEF